MKAFRYITAVATIVAMAACQNDDLDLGGYANDPDAVRINAAVSNVIGTRSFPTEDIGSAKATQFDDAAQISVKTDGQEAVTYEYTDPDKEWTPLMQKYLKWQTSSQMFTAYYPAGKYTGMELVPAIQNTAAAITDADFMMFEGRIDKPTDGAAITLAMKRKTARAIISEIKWGEQYDAQNHLIESIEFNCNGTDHIQPYSKKGKYYALLNPGIASDNTFLTIVVKNTQNGTTTTETVRGIPAFEAGYSYEYTLTIGKESVTLGSVKVTDWADGGTIGDDENMTEEVIHQGIDLGLPSGTLWACCNIGANAPEEVGDYFAWGETEPKSDYSWSTYKYGSNAEQLTKYCNSSSYGKDGFTDNLVTLESSDDAATANWGSDWRMPTQTEMQELIDECTWTWTTDYNGTGVAGHIVSSNAAGNTNAIFLPAASYRTDANEPDSAGSYGYYWCSSLDTETRPDYARAIYIYAYNSGGKKMESYGRYYGLSIRAVFKSTN